MFWKTKLCLGILHVHVQQGALARGDMRLFSGKGLCFGKGGFVMGYWNRTHRDDQSQHESGIFAWRNRALLFNDRALGSMDSGEIGESLMYQVSRQGGGGGRRSYKYSTYSWKTTYMNILFWVTLGSESSVAGEPKEGTSIKTFPFLSSSAISLYIVQLQKISLLTPQKGLMKFPGLWHFFKTKKCIN